MDKKDKLINNLRNALRDADKDSNRPFCLGCGHERDEVHKADCLIYPGLDPSTTKDTKSHTHSAIKPRPSRVIGTRVSIPWKEEVHGKGYRKIPNLTGTIRSVNGGYIYVKIDNNPRYDVLELYETEFTVIE